MIVKSCRKIYMQKLNTKENALNHLQGSSPRICFFIKISSKLFLAMFFLTYIDKRKYYMRFPLTSYKASIIKFDDKDDILWFDFLIIKICSIGEKLQISVSVVFWKNCFNILMFFYHFIFHVFRTTTTTSLTVEISTSLTTPPADV